MNRKRQMTQKEAQRTTTVVAIATFVGLSLIAVVAWARTRPERPAFAASAAPAAALQAAPAATAEEHDHDHDFERISVDELKAGLDKGEIAMIDVRTMEQFMAAHIPGSLHIPVPRIEGEVPYLPKGKLIVTYCTCPAEESSGQAAMILARSGIKAKALTGGLDAWTKLGYPTAAGVQ